MKTELLFSMPIEKENNKRLVSDVQKRFSFQITDASLIFAAEKIFHTSN